MKIAIIGFGEAGEMFGAHLAAHADVHAFDLKNDAAIKAKAATANVSLHANLAKAIDGAKLVLSLVTADQATPAAEHAAQYLQANQYFLEMNSVAPGTKLRNAEICSNLVDIAIAAPVHPLKEKVPLLLSHPNGKVLTEKLNALGLNVRCVGDEVGRAAAIKMCRSIMIKGMEALTIECFQTARFYDVEDEIKTSLHGSFPGMGWDKDRVEYWFERVSTHGLRRAEEMREVAKTVSGAKVESKMSSTVADTFEQFMKNKV
ncbi:dehydrogenase [Litorimonas cladophorae]|uniref:Dehydrogenase n=1 Tax=Litorimonas cladophorae TaxID=1220491 RepID=A0A918KGW9_9PROT|nr:NAD(P)-dependent oxidoreductase [Litorimonas cladophorae]GGX63051.1 dehydrogenase [Litorimonas cladophorae]